VQLSYFLRRVGLDHVVLDRCRVPGAFFKEFPRHRKLLSINKVFTGTDDPEKQLRWDWNSLLSDEGEPLLSDFTHSYFPDADDLVAYLEAFVRRHKIPIEYGFSVESVSRDPVSRRFLVVSRDGRARTCDRLIVATGVSRPWQPQFPGVDLCENYTEVSVHPQSFVNQRVLIVGKGNSAFETADNLIPTASLIHLASPHPLKMAWRTHFVGNLRAVNNNLLDTYQLKSQNAVLDAEIVEVKQSDGALAVTFSYAHANGEVETLTYDRIILCTGFRFDGDIFDASCRPQVTQCGKLPLMTSQWESENVPDMFFAGTLMQYRDYKRYMSSFIHGFRYNIRALTRMLEQRYHNSPWPARAVRTNHSALTEALLVRMNRSSALWQQPGFLADIVRIDPGQPNAEYFEELPLDYAMETKLPRGRWLTLTLEYGKEKPLDPFYVERVHRTDADNAARSLFLHPILRYYIDGEQVAEHHVLEDLAAEWMEPEHIDPLRQFVEQLLDQQDESSTRTLATSYPVPEKSGLAPPYERLGKSPQAKAS
jgi:thioredoxin reductase